MIYMEYKYAYPDGRGIAAFGTCNVSMENHLNEYDIRPDMANIVGVEPGQIVLLERKMIDTQSMQTKADVYKLTPGLLNCIAWLLVDSSAGEETKEVVGEWLSEMRRMLGAIEAGAS